jgi:hypothetical protein
MSAPDDSYRTAPTWQLIDDLLDNRPEVYKRAKMGIANAAQTRKKNTSSKLVAMDAERSKPASK